MYEYREIYVGFGGDDRGEGRGDLEIEKRELLNIWVGRCYVARKKHDVAHSKAILYMLI